MKRVLILLMLFAAPTYAQTNTFCASNLTCNVAAQWNFTNENDILWVGTGGYATIAAAVTAAGSTNKTIIGIRSSYAGTECPTFQSNLAFFDFRGGNLVNCTQNVAVYNTDDGNVKAMVKETSFFTAVDAAGGDVTRWMLTYLSNATVVASDVVDGLEDDARTINTLTGTLGILDGAEATADVQSTGGTISLATGTAGLVSTIAASTTAVTNAYGLYGIGCSGNIAGAVPTNCYGVYAKGQAASASTRNYGLGVEANMLMRYDGVTLSKWKIDAEDNTGTVQNFLFLDGANNATHVNAVNAQGLYLDTAGTGVGRITTTGLRLGDQNSPGATLDDNGTALFRGNTFVVAGANFTPFTAGGVDLGTTALPWGNLWVGTAATNNFKFQPGTTTGARIITITDPVSPTTVGLPLLIASGTATMTSGAITAATCQAAITVAGTGVATTDSIEWAYNAAPTLTTDALLHISPYVTAGNVNFTRCNPTAGSITGTAIVINWRVIR